MSKEKSHRKGTIYLPAKKMSRTTSLLISLQRQFKGYSYKAV